MRHYVNLGAAERGLRVLTGIVMLAVGWLGMVPGLWSVALQLFGWFPLVTGLAGWCPFYVLVGRPRKGPRASAGGVGSSPGAR